MPTLHSIPLNDDLLVMLIQPGTRETANLAHLTKIDVVYTRRTAGVDRSGYVVVGCRLFTRSDFKPSGSVR